MPIIGVVEKTHTLVVENSHTEVEKPTQICGASHTEVEREPTRRCERELLLGRELD